jgi:PAS domain S-box-containing protein
MKPIKTYEQLVSENATLHQQLEEATDTIEAIRTGQVDALVVQAPDQKHQLYTLKTADQTYRVFIEKMNEGAVTLNEDGIILYSNSRFAGMVNTPLSQVVGQHFDKYIPPGYHEDYLRLFEKGWRSDCKEELYIKHDGGLIACQLSLTTLELDEGKSLSIILTDLTFQKSIQKLLSENNKRLEEINNELELSNHDLQQFASVASHDLQEPLRKIMIFSTMLREKHKHELTEESETFLNKIIVSSNRMKLMINDILSYSHLSLNASNLTLVELNEVLTEVLEDYELLIEEKKAVIQIENPLPSIEANRGQIKQVFQNLISNAIKFSKADTSPVISVSSRIELNEECPETSRCYLTFKDNGIGFNAKFSDKIFSLFERLNTKDKFEGSGIGLAITKKIIDKHNGQISATSVEGSGARFDIVLPIHQIYST